MYIFYQEINLLSNAFITYDFNVITNFCNDFLSSIIIHLKNLQSVYC